ncbi:CAP domain-containing protein [Candidatus Uhrbacteria bacterium]|jgi:hypothetical protein|nr:CAP domain-containing protein [Candidatus Uhrbacteria bacterium]MBT7717726.1 CAP domain-containing protein [Candidatus Uhrbacteria bacterium]
MKIIYSFIAFIVVLMAGVGMVHAAQTEVSTDTSWVSEVASPGAYNHVRDGDVQQIDPEEYLNRYRAMLGVSELATSETLRQSAQNHADYLAINGQYQGDPHGQGESLPGFTGATPDDRCSAEGYGLYCTEVQAYGGGDLYSAIDALMMTPFHRVSMIHPGITEIGCAQNGSWMVCDLGLDISDYWSIVANSSDPIMYPADGQVISTTFLVTENPNPYPAHYGQFIGPTLMYWPAGGIIWPEAEVSVYDLTDGRSIDSILSVDTATGSAGNAIFFNPLEPLELDHEYAVHVIDISGDDLYEASWTFKTQQSSNIDFPNADQTIIYDAHVDWVDPSGGEVLVSVPNSGTSELIDRLKGYIMLAVDYHGEAWYVDPITELRYYLKDGPTAYEFLRSFGLGITNADLESIPTEDDAYGGGALAEQLSGRILLQIEEHGEAWYINPADLKRYYLADGDEAYRIMRELSWGTLLAAISGIPIGLVE